MGNGSRKEDERDERDGRDGRDERDLDEEDLKGADGKTVEKVRDAFWVERKRERSVRKRKRCEKWRMWTHRMPSRSRSMQMV